jgi:hypothetical protein
VRLRNWLITYGLCYLAFLGIMALWLSWATSDLPEDFWPVFTAEAVGGVLVAWLMALAFWKMIYYMHPGVSFYHRSQKMYYAKNRVRQHETKEHFRLDPAGLRPYRPGGMEDGQEVFTGHYC